jgi:hypothetical protein
MTPGERTGGRDLDEGTTLTELMIIIALLGFVLAAAYGLVFVMQQGVAVGSSIAAQGSTYGEPAEFTSRIIMQAAAIGWNGTMRTPSGQLIALPAGVQENPTEHAFAVRTDRVPFDGSWELDYFHVDTSTPTMLVFDQWGYATNGNTPIASKRITWPMSASIVPVSPVPLFTYYDAQQNPIPSTNATLVVSGLRSVLIQLPTYGPNGSPVVDTRRISLRN